MNGSTDTEKTGEETPEARAFKEEIRQGVRTADAATIRAARVLEAMERSRVHRDLGVALLGDAAASLGLSPRRGRELLDLGRALFAYPELEAWILERKLPLEKVIAIVPGMLVRRMEIREWAKVIRANDARALRRIARRETRNRIVDGVRYTKEYVDLSPIGRAMLFDAQAMFSRLRESAGDGTIPATMTLPRSDVLAKAIAAALEAVEKGAAVGERRYRIAEHEAGSFEIVAAEIRERLVLLSAQRGRFRMELERPANVADVLDRMRKRLGVAGRDVLEVAGKAIAEGVFVSERRPLAHALMDEIASALAAERISWHRIARAMAYLERLRVPGWRDWAARVIRRSPSTVSELLGAGEAALRFPEVARALDEGRLDWTHVRTLAPYMKEENIHEMLPLLLESSVRELEKVRVALSWEANRATERVRGSRPGSDLSPVEIELSGPAWRGLDRLARLLAQKTGRVVSVAHAIEEALWQALVIWGAPSPLWNAYRVLVHHDRETGVAWMVGPGDIVPVSSADLTKMRSAGAVVFDVTAELARARKAEIARLTGVLAGMDPGATPEPERWLRRLIHVRDGGRCSVCHCHACLFVHVHHIRPRAEGGSNDPENLALICVRCHGAAHSNFARLVPRQPRPARIFEIEAGSRRGAGIRDPKRWSPGVSTRLAPRVGA